jgi:dihydroorotate dehydrogenase (NAD+) catalytic subunit
VPAPCSARCAPPVIINIAGHSPDDFAALAARLDPEPGIAALELNMSCPNVAHGMDFSSNPDAAKDVVTRVRAKTGLPLIAKLSPNVTDVRPIAKAAVAAGANAVSVINTLSASRSTGAAACRSSAAASAASGPAIKLRGPAHRPRRVARSTRGHWHRRYPDADDAMEFLVAGASAIQVGTANYYLPTACVDILDGLPSRFAALGATKMGDVVGTLRDPLQTA